MTLTPFLWTQRRSRESKLEAVMSRAPELNEWNAQVLNLVQALLGAISPNLRMVFLSRANDEWLISFLLERENETDRDDIEDVMAQYEALQARSVPCRVEIKVSSENLDWPSPPARVVFRRREN